MKFRWLTLENRVTAEQAITCMQKQGISFAAAMKYLQRTSAPTLQVLEDGCWHTVHHVTMSYEEYENERKV